MRLYEVFESYCPRSFVLTSDINNSCPIPTFSTLASLILPPPPSPQRSFLASLVFRPLPERLTCFGHDGHTEWRWKWFTERSKRRYKLRPYMLWKVCASRNAFIPNWADCWVQISKKFRMLKALKETARCVYGSYLEYGNEKGLQFFFRFL